jgi:hypothetical protein
LKYKYKEIYSPNVQLDIVVTEDDMRKRLWSETRTEAENLQAIDEYLKERGAVLFSDLSMKEFEDKVKRLDVTYDLEDLVKKANNAMLLREELDILGKILICVTQRIVEYSDMTLSEVAENSLDTKKRGQE